MTNQTATAVLKTAANQTVTSFDIREHEEKLTPAKDKGYFECPVCGDDNFTFDSQTAKYQCWSNHCDPKDIKNALKPFESGRGNSAPRRKAKSGQRTQPIPFPDKVILARLEAPATDSPSPRRELGPERGEVWVTTYPYSSHQWVDRIDWKDPTKPKGYDKTFRQGHTLEDGTKVYRKGEQPWHPYRFEEAIQAANSTPSNFLISVEGEKCVEAIRRIGLAAVTFQGSAWGKPEISRFANQLKRHRLGLIHIADNDEPGRKKGESLQAAFDQVGVPCLILDPLAIDQELAEKGDVANILESMSAPDFIRRLEAEIHAALGFRIEEQKLNDPAERFKLDLLRLAKETDPFLQILLRNEICSTYRIPRKEVEKALEKLEQAHSTPRQTVFTFDEFLEQETTALPWLVPGLLAAGETVLLAASAKTGKTNLATDLTYAVLTGNDFLGTQVIKGKVLFVSCDESPNSTRRRMKSRGFDLLERKERENLSVMTHLDLTDLSPLEKQLEDFRPNLVVIDCLTTIALNVGVAEKDPEFARYVYRLKDLLGRYGASGLLIHHESKDPFAKGIKQIAGSSRIPAAVWSIWQLKAADENNDSDPKRLLKIKPREGEAVTLSLTMNPKGSWDTDGIFLCLGEVGDESGEKRTQADLVLKLLQEFAPRGLTYKEIDERLKFGRSLYQVLDRLEDRQQISKRRSKTDSRSWIYALPDVTVDFHSNEGDTPPPSVKDDCVVELTETSTMQGLESIQQQFNNNSTTIQQSTIETKVLNCQDDDSAKDLTQIQQIQQMEGGGVPSKFVESDSSVTVTPNLPSWARRGVNALHKPTGNRFPIFRVQPSDDGTFILSDSAGNHFLLSECCCCSDRLGTL